MNYRQLIQRLQELDSLYPELDVMDQPVTLVSPCAPEEYYNIGAVKFDHDDNHLTLITE